MSRGAARGAVALTMIGCPLPAIAQAAPEGALRPGVRQPTLPQPDYARPPASQPVISAPPSRDAVVASGGTVILTSVEVEGDSAGRPIEQWPSQRDPATGLTTALGPTDILGPDWLRRQFSDNGLVGRPAPYARIVAFIQLLNARFASEGYVNSGVLVPPQPAITERGPLRLRLVLGRVPQEAFTVTDPRGGLSPRYIRERLPAAASYPFNAAEFERDFRLLAEDPAVTNVNADLRPLGRAGQASLAVTVVAAERVDLYASFANSRTPSIGANRWALGGSIDHALIAGDAVAAEVGRTRGVTDFVGSYRLPLFGPRTRLFVAGGANDAAVIDAVLEPLDIKTKSYSLSGGIEHDLIATPLMPAGNGRFHAAHTLTAKLQGDFRHTRTFLLGEPFSFSPGSVDGLSRYYAARAGLDFVARSISQVLAAAVTVSVGLNGTGSDIPGVAAPKKHWLGLLGQATYARRLNRHGTEVRARVAAQYHNSIAYSGERLPIGGYNSVRGYRETQYLVDNAAIGSIELSQPLRLGGAAPGDGFDPGAFTLASFVDAAWFGNHALPDPPRDFIAGAGVTVTWVPHRAFSARLTWAKNFHQVGVAGDRDLQDHGIYFAVTVRPLPLLRRRSATAR